jgi:hypothetical protein
MFEMEIMEINNFKVASVYDGNLIHESIKIINEGQANGINFNFGKNFPQNIDEVKFNTNIKYVQINDYSWDFNYSAINSLMNLEHLSIYTKDKIEINYSNFPFLKSTAITWRPNAKTLFNCVNLERLFIGGYNETDLSRFKYLKNLKYLRINTGSLKSLNGIEKLEGIETLLLSQPTKLEDIRGIELLPNLNHIQINNCRNIKNIEILEKLNDKVKIHILGSTPKLNS